MAGGAFSQNSWSKMVVNDDTFMLTDATAYLCSLCSRVKSILAVEPYFRNCNKGGFLLPVTLIQEEQLSVMAKDVMLCIGTPSQGGAHEQCG